LVRLASAMAVTLITGRKRVKGARGPSSRRASRSPETRQALREARRACAKKKSGDVLLSHRASPAVPSALEGLTSEFGMGSGVTPPPWSPENRRHPSRLGQRPEPAGLRSGAPVTIIGGRHRNTVKPHGRLVRVSIHLPPINLVVSEGPSVDRSPGDTSSWGRLPA
jgi:hypothetical protein